MNSKTKDMLGRKLLVDFPDFRLKNVIAKIDTGAYTGALHAENIAEIEKDGRKILHFEPCTGHSQESDPVEVEDYRIAKITSSTGHRQVRYVIITSIVINNKTYNIELSLTDRSTMRIPVLIGRKFLRGKFVIDVELG
jgi:hypothetical protein